MLRILSVAGAVLGFAGSAHAVELVQPASLGSTLFDAAPISTTDAKGRSAKLVFTPGGALTRTSASGQASEGTWRLSEAGFCMQVGQAKRESCYIVLKQPDGRYSALRAGQSYVWEK